MLDIPLLNEEIANCRLCPRLVAWREHVAWEKKAAHINEEYWGKPVPCFGDEHASHLILGLAPAAHGANRTGQMFTGDRSGEWLFRALHKAGVANLPNATSKADGMKLTGALMAASCHCAPPANKPTPDETQNCSRYTKQILDGRDWQAILCLGSIAWNHVHRLLGVTPPKFGHGEISNSTKFRIVASYHPSQQNTFTGRLTEPMLDAAIAEWLRDLVNE